VNHLQTHSKPLGCGCRTFIRRTCHVNLIGQQKKGNSSQKKLLIVLIHKHTQLEEVNFHFKQVSSKLHHIEPLTYT